MLGLNLINPAIIRSDSYNKGVRYCNSDFANNLKKWALIDIVLSDKEQLLKQGPLILPKPSEDVNDKNLNRRYENYQMRAVWYGVTRRTLSGLSGEVFATAPTLEGIEGTDLAALEDDCDGSGVTLEQQARATLTLAIAFGRGGLLTDYPKAEKSSSYRDQLDGDLHPVIHRIEPQNIRNWRTQRIGSKKKLTLVVLFEYAAKSDDGYKVEIVDQWRVLKLENLLGQWVYTISVYQNDDKGEPQLIDYIMPTKPDGSFFNEITFTFVGPETNEAEINNAPLYDMAELNIAHFRNSADYEENLFFAGQVTPVFSGFTPEFIAAVPQWRDGTITLGSRAAVLLPVNGTAELLQAGANSMPMEGMLHKEDQMRALGAKLVEQASTTKTATQDTRESSEDSSVLASCAVNVSRAFTRCLQWAAEFVGMQTDGIEYELSTAFTTTKMNYNDRMQLMKEWQGGAISFEEYRFLLRRDGVAYLPDNKAKSQIQQSQSEEMAAAVDHAAELSVATSNDNPPDNNA